MANLQIQYTHVDKQPTIHKYVSIVLELADMLAVDKKKKDHEIIKNFMRLSILSAVTMKITVFLDVKQCIIRSLETHT